jgi:tight adherence protein B
MAIGIEYIVLGAIFLIVILAVEGVFYFLAGGKGGAQRRVNRRLKMLASGDDAETVLQKLRRADDESGTAVNFLQSMLGGWRPVANFNRMITHAGIRMPLGQVVLGMMVLALVGAAMGLVMSTVVTAVIFAVLAGVVLPVAIIKYKKGRRLKAFSSQLPDALDIIVRSLRAGHPISAALGMVADEMKDPIGTEFGLAIDEMTYGLDLREALDNMLVRTGHGDLQFMVAAVNIQSGVGGNLSEILAGLSKVIRDRHRMILKIKALSAEGRISAIILSVLPFLVFGFIKLSRPEYFDAVKDDPLYMVFMVTSASMAFAGIMTMYKMVKFRI